MEVGVESWREESQAHSFVTSPRHQIPPGPCENRLLFSPSLSAPSFLEGSWFANESLNKSCYKRVRMICS
jgi:hypothetical protein